MDIYGVIKFQAPFEKLKEYECSAEVSLYKAILTQAVIDATNISVTPSLKRFEIEAKNWIFGNSEHFQEVCFLANVEPCFIVKITKDAIQLNIAKGRSFYQ